MLQSPTRIAATIRQALLGLGFWLLSGGLLLSIRADAPSAKSDEEVRLLSRRIADDKITPRSFSHFFSAFGFELNSRVQPPRVFITRRKGDCDDYAVLADIVLPHHGYSTRLIHIRLAGKTDHAVCYVDQDRVFLDYNNRDYFITLAKSKPDLAAIADKVADSLRANWTTASEFEYCFESKRKTFTKTVAKVGNSRAR